MTNPIQILRSTVASNVPTLGTGATDNNIGYNAADAILHWLDDGDNTQGFDLLSARLPWTLDGPVIPISVFDVSTQSTVPTGLYITDDGLKMYISDNSTDKIFQYTLSTAWALSSASFDSKEFDVSGQATIPSGVWLTPDGKRMFVSAQAPSSSIFQYDLGTAFDVSTAVYNSITLSVTSQGQPRDLFFRADGLRMFLPQTNGHSVFQYSLTTAYDLSTASFDSKSKDVSSEITSIADVFFKDDGTKMFVADGVSGGNSGIVYQYTLSTAWDVSTATFDSISVNLSVDNIGSMFFKKHGATLFITDTVDDEAKSFELANQNNNPFTDDEREKLTDIGSTESIILDVSRDETTALTTGTAKYTFRMPYDFKLITPKDSVTTAPTGSGITVDINKNGTSILSTKLTIDATEKTSFTAATPAVISDNILEEDDEITIDIDVVGSTIAGAGLKVQLIGTRNPLS